MFLRSFFKAKYPLIARGEDFGAMIRSPGVLYDFDEGKVRLSHMRYRVKYKILVN